MRRGPWRTTNSRALRVHTTCFSLASVDAGHALRRHPLQRRVLDTPLASPMGLGDLLLGGGSSPPAQQVVAAVVVGAAAVLACRLAPRLSLTSSSSLPLQPPPSSRGAATEAEPEPEAEIFGQVAQNLKSVNARIAAKSEELGRAPPVLVAVSKTKPLEYVQAGLAAGQRDFGENYIQELAEKSKALADTPGGIRWHYIGQLQSNKVKLLAACPNLALVHTLPSAKTARKLSAACEELRLAAGEPPLGVLVQVNTSGEHSKGGAEPADAAELCRIVHSATECPGLKLEGLMCIGKYGADSSEDFEVLIRCRVEAAKLLGVAPESLGLSMGMSHDFEQAIEYGATFTRCGSNIFGARKYSNAGKQ